MAPGKVVQTLLSYNNAKVKGLPSHEGEIALSYPGRDMKIADKLMQVNKNTYENHFTVQWQKGKQATVQSTYTKTGKDIHNIENTLRLPNKKEAKATGMLQVKAGAYKTKLQFAADEGLIFRQKINYMAEGGATYTINPKQISTDVNAEVMWAPNQKISANFNFDYRKTNLFTSKLTFSTPFDAMKNFDGQTKYTWANRKYTSMMSVSWNKQNELKQDFSFAYPNFELSYDASALLNGKKSEIGLAMKYSDMSVNGNIKVSHGKTTIIDVILKHNNQKIGVESEMGLDFDILDASGKMKITLKYDKRKGELMSNGEGKLNLPVQQLRQISASYNLKHNNDLSSIDMSYSSSLRNYKNGKMMIEMKRNLPKMLKATMNLTLNGNPVVNINADYGKKKDDIDMKVEVTEANGKKNTASGNINLSGDRKTANVEIKSRYIDFSVDGSLDYQGPSSVDGELKVTANGKSVMINVNYKKEGNTYKVSGTLGLPDGRPLKMEGSLDLKNNIVALKTMSPDFPELTEVDLVFSFNGDKRMFSSTAFLKVMPYFDTTQFEMKFTKKQLSIGMKSKFESWKQAKLTVTFDGDWVRSQKLKAVFKVNNEEMLDLEMNYDFKSVNDFIVSMAALTSHRRYKEFQFDLKKKGPFSAMQSSLKMKLVNILMFDVMFQNSKKAIKLSIDGQLLDFDEWKSTFELKGNLNSMTVNIITNKAEKEVNKIEASLKDFGRSIVIKVNGPNAVNLNFNMDVDTEAITFNMASTFTSNDGAKYEMSASYEHLSKLQIKTSIPNYQDKLLITFSGNLEVFNMQTKFSHNNQIYELILSNKQYYRQVDGILNTPYFQDTASFKLTGNPEQMNIVAQVMHNKDKFELTFSNSGYYQQIDAKLDTPYFQPTLKFSLRGNLEKFNFELKINFDQMVYEMKASNEEYFRKMNFLLETPKLNCNFRLTKNGVSLHLSYAKTKFELKIRTGDNYILFLHFVNPDFNNFKVIGDRSWFSVFSNQLSSLEEGKIELSSSAKGENMLAFLFKSYSDTIRKINATLSSQGNSILVQDIKSQIFVNNNEILNVNLVYDVNSLKDLSGSFSLETSLIRFTHVSLVFKHLQEQSNWESVLKIKVDRQIIFEGKLRISTSNKQISVETTLKTIDAWKALLNSNDYLNDKGTKELSSRIVFSQKQKTTINAVITIPEDFNFELKSELDIEKISFNLRSHMKLKQKELFKIFASYEHKTKLHARITVLHYNAELKMTFDRNLRTLNSSLKLKLANFLMFNAMFQNSKKAIELSIDGQLLDFDEWKSTFELKGNLNSMTVNIITNKAEKEVNKIEASLKDFGRSIVIKVNSPNAVNLNFNMDVDTEAITFNMASTFTSNDGAKYEMSASYEHLSKLQIKTSIPNYQDKLLITFSGNLEVFNMQTKFSHNNQIYELILSNKQYYRQVDGILNTPYFQDTASFKLTGTLSR